MIRSLFVLAIALVFPVLGAGQTTWRALRFGMPLADARETLAKSGSEVKPGRGTEAFNVTPNFDMDVPGTVLPARFRPVLAISEKGLYAVTLTLDWAAYRNSTPSFSPATVISSLSEPIFEQLTSKYGRPMNEAGTCTGVSVTSFLSGRRMPTCRAVWKGDKQTVTLSWAYTREEDSTFFLVEYKPESEGL